MAELPTADEFFGSSNSQLPTADEFFADHSKEPLNAMDVPGVGEVPTSSPDIDNFLKNHTIGHVLKAFGQGAEQGWGTEPLGISPESRDYLGKIGLFNDYKDGQTSLLRSANEALFRPAAAALDAAMRVPQAAFGAYQAGAAQTGEELGEPQLGRDIAALPEAFQGSPHPTGAVKPVDLAQAKSLGIIGGDEATWKGTAPVAADESRFENETAALKAQAEQNAEQAKEAGTSEPSPVEPAQPDVHTVARQIAPEVFQEFDSLQQRKDTFRRWIDELRDSRLQQVTQPYADEIADLQRRLSDPDTTKRLAKKYQSRLENINDQIEERTQGDSADMAKIRQKLMETDYAMRDIAPQVGRAYQAAQEQLPKPEVPVEATSPEQPAETASNVEQQPTEETTEPAPQEQPEAQPVPATQSGVDQLKAIAQDVTKKLVAAGRPQDEASAAAAIVASHYEARAARFNGEKGTAQDLYNAEGPEIRAGRNIPKRALELAQKDKELFQYEDTPSFKNWFEGSKIVDDDGKPKLLYHGSGHQIEQFNTEGGSKTTGNVTAVWGSFFTHDPEEASRYAEMFHKEGQNVTPVYLAIKNPYEMTRAEWDQHAMVVFRKQKTQEEALADERVFKKRLEDEGYDGIIINGRGFNSEYVAFNPEQIKSAIANRGTFSGESPKIFEQTQKGKINVRDDARNTITLFKSADASTFLHETGHQWLEELLSDAADEKAPDDLKNDAQTVRDWLGSKDGEAITRKQHEKFARGFETYMMEGRAPSTALAKVFEQFRQWLTSIYQTVSKLRSPITDDIRDVFDRLIVNKPERTVVAPEREAAGNFADLHEADAETTPPEKGREAAGIVQTERDRVAADKVPEEQDVRLKDVASGAGRRAAGSPELNRTGNVTPPNSGEGGSNPQSGAVGASGSEVARESAATRTETATLTKSKSEVPATPHSEFPPSETPLVDKAGNFRMENINAPEDVKQAIRDSVSRNNEFMDERRGVVTDAQALALADAMGMDAADLDRRQIGQAFNKEEIFRLEKLFIQSATSARDAAKAALDAGTDEAFAAYAEAESRQLMILDTVAGHAAGVRAEAGRALQAYNALKGMPGYAEAHAVADLLKESTGKTLYQLKKRASAIANLDTPAKVAGAIRDSEKPGLGAMALEVFKNWLISGPITHSTYAIGNATLALWKAIPETAIEAAVGAAREAITGETVSRAHVGEVGSQLYAMFKGQRDGWMAAKDSFKAGQTMRLPHEALDYLTESQRAKYDKLVEGGLNFDEAMEDMGINPDVSTPFTNTKAVPDFNLQDVKKIPKVGNIAGSIVGDTNIPIPLGSIVRFPGERMVAPIHSYFRTIGYIQSVARQAYRTAYEEGLTGHAFNERIADLTRSPSEEMMKIAREDATLQTLMGKGGELTRRVGGLVNWQPNLPVLGPTKPLAFIDPFVHVASNIVEQSVIERSPLGIFAEKVRADLAGRNGPRARDLTAARMLAGTSLSIVGGGLAMEGLINPSAPSDPKEAAMWRMVHGMPHSANFGDVSVDLSRLGVIGFQLGIAADLYHMADRIGKDDASKIASLLVHSFTQNFLDEGFMRGPSDLIKALDEPDRFGGRYVQNLASSFAVPFSIGSWQIARLVDPYSREARSTIEQMKAKVPWLSETLEPRYDVWGQPVLNRDFWGVYVQRLADDPVNRELLRLGIYPSKAPRMINGVELTEHQYSDFARISGRMAKASLDAFVRMPGYDLVPDAQKSKIIHDNLNTARESARSLIKINAMRPDSGNNIVQKAYDNKTAKLRGEKPTVH